MLQLFSLKENWLILLLLLYNCLLLIHLLSLIVLLEILLLKLLNILLLLKLNWILLWCLIILHLRILLNILRILRHLLWILSHLLLELSLLWLNFEINIKMKNAKIKSKIEIMITFNMKLLNSKLYLNFLKFEISAIFFTKK